MLVDVEATGGPGSDDHSPPPSQLLRDLDNCNSDPVAVASCFVERVRRAGCLPLVLFCWGTWAQWDRVSHLLECPSPGEVPGVLSGTGRVFLGGAEGCWWMAYPRQMGTKVGLPSCSGARGVSWAHLGVQSNGSFPEVALFGFSVESRV